MFERFTERARKVMSLARQEAENSKSEFIGTEHLLLGIASEGGGVAYKVLGVFGISIAKLREEALKIVKPPAQAPVYSGQIPLSPRVKRVIELAGEVAYRIEPEGAVIGTESLLVGLVLEREGIAYQVLKNLGVDPSSIEKTVYEVLGMDSEAKRKIDECARCHGTGREPLTEDAEKALQWLKGASKEWDIESLSRMPAHDLERLARLMAERGWKPA